MTFRKSSLNRIAVIALALCSVGAAGCNGEHRSAEDRRADKAYEHVTSRLDDTLDDLEATADQRKQVHTVKDDFFDQALGFHKGSREARKAAFEELKRDEPDGKKLHALVDERLDEMRKLMHQAVDGALEIHGTLTPEQRADIARRIEEHMADHHE